jgi:hypothetical protein
MLKKAVNAGTYNVSKKDCLPAETPAKLITWLAAERPKDLKGRMVDVFDEEILKRADLKIKTPD